MKIKSFLKIFLIILLILFISWFFTSGKIYLASAAEVSTVAAPGDDFEILPNEPGSGSGTTEQIPEQDYEGISINSHIANDFAYLGLDSPSTYAKGNEKKVITIAEAIFKENGELKKEVVIYFYHPAYKQTPLPGEKLDFTFKLWGQSLLINDEYVNQLLPAYELGDKTTSVYEVSHYNGIKKYAFSTRLNKWLLSEPTASISGKNTLIKVNLSKTGYFDDYPYNGRVDVVPTKLFEQEFQFISESTPSATRSANEYTNTSLCVAYDVNTVSVDGKALRYRYKTDDVGKLNFISSTRDAEFTDIFYFFFNVTDDDSKIKWGAEKYITEVNLKYFEAQVKSVEKSYYDGLHKDIQTKTTVDYKKSNGDVYKTDTFIDEEVKFLEKDKLKEIYQTQKIVPEKIEFEFIANSNHNTWVAFTTGKYETLKTSYLTLFNTKSPEIQQYLDTSSEEAQTLTNDYNFGLVYGNKDGYSASKERTTFSSGMTFMEEITEELYYVELVEIVDIKYNENGATYRVEVSSTNVDNSEVMNPRPPEDDLWPDEPGEPRPKNPEKKPWWERLVEWFLSVIEKIKNFFLKLKSFFSSSKSIIIFVAITLGAIILIISLFKFINFVNTARVAKGMRNNKKE